MIKGSRLLSPFAGRGRLKLMVVLGSALLACFVRAVQFDAAEPIWTTAERGEINSTIAFATRFEWDGKAPHLWDETSSFLGRTYPTAELKYTPSVDWWKRTIEPKAKFAGEVAKVDATQGVRYEGAINDTGFLRLKVKVSKPGRLLVGFDEILVSELKIGAFWRVSDLWKLKMDKHQTELWLVLVGV